MASLLCVQRPGGKMLIHDSEAVSHLIDPASSPFATSAGSTSSRSKSTSLAPASSPDRKTETASSFGGRAGTIKDWLNAKSVKELQDRADKETRSTRKLLTTLFDGEKTIVKDTDDYLDEKQVLSLRKKELLHKKWSDNVYEPLREKIHKEMDGSNWPEVDRRKREMHKQYLEFSNKKGHVFLDIIDPAEYYPLAMHAHRPAPLKVATQRLRDPLLSQGSQRNDEARTVLRCVTGNHYTDQDVSQIQMPLLPLVPLGRHGTQFSTWLAMPLHNIESTDRLASRRRMRGENRHQMDFGTWAKAPFDPSVIDEEMKVQRRRTFDRVESSTNHLTHLSNPVLVDATTNTSQEVDH